MNVIIIIDNKPTEVSDDVCKEIMRLRSENAALRAALDSLRTKIADAAKGDCRKLHEFERIALAMKEAQP
jgi:hypothetical protein